MVIIRIDLKCGLYIVACQRGGVSDEPPWLRAATRHGPGTLRIKKKTRTDTGPVLLRQGDPGTAQYKDSYPSLFLPREAYTVNM